MPAASASASDDIFKEILEEPEVKKMSYELDDITISCDQYMQMMNTGNIITADPINEQQKTLNQDPAESTSSSSSSSSSSGAASNQSSSKTSHMQQAPAPAVASTQIFRCSLCPWLFYKTPHKLNLHIFKEHGQQSQYICHICNQPQPSRNSLVNHLQKHALDALPQQKAAIASQGNRILINKGLIRVEESDSKKLFYCNHEACSDRKPYRSHDSIQVHIRRHHTPPETWKFACPICNKRFSIHAALIEHMSSHSTKRLFTCEACPKSYKQLSALRTHVRKCHSNNPQ